MSITIAINTAIRSMRTHTYAIDVTSHNIANMNNEGYSRQVAEITSTKPFTNYGGAGQIGTGSYVSRIQRLRDIYLDKQIRGEMENLGKWEVLNQTYDVLKALFPEVEDPTAPGIQKQLEEFWSAWDTLAQKVNTDPTDIEGEKADVYNKADNLARLLNNRAMGLIDLQINLNNEFRDIIDQINLYTKQIAELNKEIINIYSVGQQPNDLLDKRDLLVKKLSELVNINVGNKTDGSIVIHIRGHVLVDGTKFNKMTYISGKKDSKFERVGLFEYQAGQAVDITESVLAGKLGGILEARDYMVQWYRSQLDILASSLITVLNKIHMAGTSTGPMPVKFFVGDRATNISVNLELNKGTNIAAIADLDPGPGVRNINLAELISKLDNKIMNSWVKSQRVSINIDSLIGKAGTILINGVSVNYYATDTVADLIERINAINPDKFFAVFNNSTDPLEHGLYIFANEYLTIEENSSNPFIADLDITQQIWSAAPTNYEGAIQGNQIDFTKTWWEERYKFDIEPRDSSTGFNTSTLSGKVSVVRGGIYRTINWGVGERVGITFVNVGIIGGLDVYGRDVNTQKVFYGTRVQNDTPGHFILEPFFISDSLGNFTESMKLIRNERFKDFYQSIVSVLNGEVTSAENLKGEYEEAINTLEEIQNNITRVDEKEELERARAYQRAYDASVKLLTIIDQMLNMLINRTATPSETWQD